MLKNTHVHRGEFMGAALVGLSLRCASGALAHSCAPFASASPASSRGYHPLHRDTAASHHHPPPCSVVVIITRAPVVLQRVCVGEE